MFRHLITGTNLISQLALFSLLLPMAPNFVFSAVPSHISYSGLISDSAGQGLNGSVDLVFNIYEDENNDGAADGSSIWTETHNSASVSNGLFNVRLGSVGGTLGNLDFDKPYLLGISVGSDAEMTPLLRFSSVPTAFRLKEQGSEFVDCTTVPVGGKIQSAVDSGAKTIIIDGVCEEAVLISRSRVDLIAEGNGLDGITGPSDGKPALQLIGASFITVVGLRISEAAGSEDEACIWVGGGSDVGFFGITVPACPDIGVDVLFNSSANFNVAAGGPTALNSITGGSVGVEVSAGASVAMSHTSIMGFADEGLFVGGNSFAFAGDDGYGGVTISSTITDATALWVEGSSSVELEGASISATNGMGAYMAASSSLQLFEDGVTNSISGASVGVKVDGGTLEIEGSSVVASDGSAIEVRNNAAVILKTGTSTITGSGTTGSDYGVECFENGVLTTPVNPNITGTDGITNSVVTGGSFCSVPVPEL
ncbi:MAG: hypothetical protein GKR93_08525 [Gammaproteobacteria bacterium]|nr:hypothetical protein [Gammaproteobacteria bacterium]